jgi:hypothetical protein
MIFDTVVLMFCAECGSKMEQREDGAWKGCCNRYGYWYAGKPVASDLWIGKPLYHEGYYFYPTVNWPNSRKPTLPKGLSPW